MKKKIVFYLTNHGYGHAARNVPIIESLLRLSSSTIIIKSDSERCAFLQRNLRQYRDRITYDTSYHEVGFLLKKSTYEVDVYSLFEKVSEEVSAWPLYIERESTFLVQEKVDVVVTDIIPWVLIAAKKNGIPSVLLCNFTWYEMYKEYLPENLCLPYYEAYCNAGKIFLYDLGNKNILNYYQNVEVVSLVSRVRNEEKIAEISNKYKHPILFVSVGKSIVMDKIYDISNFQGTVLATTGVTLKGENVVQLPGTIINTQDYIGASDYIISKTGWSSLAEIFLNGKKAAVISRGDNPEDNAVICEILKRHCGIRCTFDDLNCVEEVLEELDNLSEDATECFEDSSPRIVNYILGLS